MKVVCVVNFVSLKWKLMKNSMFGGWNEWNFGVYFSLKNYDEFIKAESKWNQVLIWFFPKELNRVFLVLFIGSMVPWFHGSKVISKVSGHRVQKAWNFHCFWCKIKAETWFEGCWKLMNFDDFDMIFIEFIVIFIEFTYDYTRHFIKFLEQMMEPEYYLELMNLLWFSMIYHELTRITMILIEFDWITTNYQGLTRSEALFHYHSQRVGSIILSIIQLLIKSLFYTKFIPNLTFFKPSN